MYHCQAALYTFTMADCDSGKHQGKGNTVQKQEKGFECSACKTRFSFRTNLNRHKKAIHKNEIVRERTSCTFPGCSAKFYHQTKLLSHLELAHGKNTDKIEQTFSSMDEFLSWKLQEEAENFVCFTKPRGALDHLSVTHQHYICQRDGSSRIHTSKKQPGRKTNRKLRKGAIKTDLVCPARMLVRQCKKSGRVNVSYYKSHSHDISPKDAFHHPLPKIVRKDIKNKLESGFTVNQIYQEFQNQCTSLMPSPTIQYNIHDNRLKLINKPQIRAIQRRLRNKVKETVQSQPEAVYGEVVEVLNITETCNVDVSEDSSNIHVQAPEQQNLPLHSVNTESTCSNITQELLFSEPVSVPNPLCEATVPLNYGIKLQAILSEILALMENENVRKTMLTCVIGNLEGMLSLCHQEANSLNHNVRHDVGV